MHLGRKTRKGGSAVSEKRFYRSRDALIGGVCAGIAEYFDIDPIVVRILAVVFTFATAGTLIVAYIALWFILPLAPDPAAPVDVQPESVHSDTYGPIDYEAAKRKAHAERGEAGSTAPFASSTGAPYGPYPNAGVPFAGTGHVPPEPPRPFVDSHQAPPEHSVPHAAQSPHVSQPAYTAQTPGSAQSPYAAYSAQTPYGAPASPPQGAQSASPQQPVEPISKKSVRAALWFGFLCLFIGFAAILSQFIEDVAWWQFWPLLLIIVGIGNVVIPAPRGKRMGQFVGGLMTISIGVVLLSMSLHAIGYASFAPMIENLWPLLVMMVGFFIISGAVKNPLFELLAGLCFVAFCVLGLIWFTVPGTVEYMTIALPFKEAVIIDINPWT